MKAKIKTKFKLGNIKIIKIYGQSINCYLVVPRTFNKFKAFTTYQDALHEVEKTYNSEV